MIRRFVRPRTWVSVARTGVYGSVAALFGLTDIGAVRFIDAMVVGALMADFITWTLHSLTRFSENLIHGCYEGLVNVLFAVFLLRFTDFQVTPDEVSIPPAFLTFLAVIGIKMLFYGAQAARDSSE